MTSRQGMGKGMGCGYKNLAAGDSHVHFLAAKGISVSPPVFKRSRMGHNPLELTLYVPSTQGREDVVSVPKQKARIADAEQEMSKLFEGYTEVGATGGWMDKGKLIQEPQGKVTSYTTEAKLKSGRKGFEEYIKRIKKDYDQDQIAIEYEGDLFFYKTKGKK